MANNFIKTTELVGKLNTEIKEHSNLLSEAATNASELNKQYAKLPSEYISKLQTIEKTNKKVSASSNKVLKTQNALEKARLSELRLQKKREKAFDNFDKQQKRLQASLQREAKALERTTGLYNKVQAGINSLTKRYNDLAVRRELNGKLTDSEVMELGKLEAKLNKYQGVLKRVDANIGKNQRNVGNYKRSFDGLGFSVAQLSREMPAFSVSMQTGFLAISNNIPMLTDEINKLKKANVDLTEQGKPTVSVLKSLGKAVFSIQTLISVGVTLLTVYGAKLIEVLTPTNDLEKATEKYNEELKEQNKALKENIELRKRQLESAKDFINNSQIVGSFRGAFDDVLHDSAEVEGALTELSQRLNKIGVDGADALRNQDILQADRVQIAINLLEIEEQNIKLEKERMRVDANILKQKEIQEKLDSGEISKLVSRKEFLKIGNTSLNETIKIQTRINELKEENNAIIGKGIELEVKVKDAKKENLKAIKLESKATKNLVETIEFHIEALEKTRKSTLKVTKEYDELTKAIDNYKKGLEGLIPVNLSLDKSLQGIAAAAESEIARMKRLREETDKFIKSVGEGALGELGLGSLTQFFDGTFDDLIKGATSVEEQFAVTFSAIADVATEAFEIINQGSQANFDQQFDRLEKQRDVAIQFAGESTAAKDEIDRQFEAKRAAIQKKQAEAEKKQAIFSIILSTAKGVVSALASPIPNVPLSIAIGAIGAAKAAIVAGTEIPAFKDGVENFEGGNAWVGDGGKHEYIRTPDGNVTKTPKTDTLVNLPKGSDVFKDEDTFLSSLYKELNLNDIMPFSDSIGRNIMPVITNNGISKAELQEVFSYELSKLNKSIKNKKETHFSLDENGFNTFVSAGNTKTKILNARVSGKGRQV